jgi:enoyl-CoA hydratase
LTDLIRSERRDGVALLTLNRPEVLNALDAETLTALGDAFAAVAKDDSVRALVLTGEGRAFAAGADIAQMQKMSALQGLEFSQLGHRVFGALEKLTIPTIAAVNGFALGGGCELALSCDWIYASSKARFGQPEVKLGLIPGFGGTSRLTRRVGIAWAKELVLSGQNLKAEEAQRIGLVNRIFEADELLPKTLELVSEMGGCGPVAQRIAKQVMQEGQDADVRLAHGLEQNGFGLAFATEDRDEGVSAFLGKRDPKFKGR